MNNTTPQIYNVLRTYHDLLKERKPSSHSGQATEMAVDRISISNEAMKIANSSIKDHEKDPSLKRIEDKSFGEHRSNNREGTREVHYGKADIPPAG